MSNCIDRWDIRKSRCTTSINNTGGKIAAGINEPGGKFFRQFCWCCWYWWQAMETISDSWQLKVNLKEKIYLYANSTTQRCPKEIMRTFLIEDFSICHQCQRHQWSTLRCEYLCKFSKKILNGPNGKIRGLGETDSCRKPEVENLVALSHDGVPWMLDLSGSVSKLILYVLKTLDSFHLLPFPFMLFPLCFFATQCFLHYCSLNSWSLPPPPPLSPHSRCSIHFCSLNTWSLLPPPLSPHSKCSIHFCSLILFIPLLFSSSRLLLLFTCTFAPSIFVPIQVSSLTVSKIQRGVINSTHNRQRLNYTASYLFPFSRWSFLICTSN